MPANTRPSPRGILINYVFKFPQNYPLKDNLALKRGTIVCAVICQCLSHRFISSTVLSGCLLEQLIVRVRMSYLALLHCYNFHSIIVISNKLHFTKIPYPLAIFVPLTDKNIYNLFFHIALYDAFTDGQHFPQKSLHCSKWVKFEKTLSVEYI